MEIDLEKLNSINELHETFKDKLGFPDFYGNNWDAFWDAITGLVDMPDDLSLIQWTTFNRNFPADAEILGELIKQFNSSQNTSIVSIYSDTREHDKLECYPCPCCGYPTLTRPNGNTFEICPICFWEDDGVQLNYPDDAGGANPISLNSARKNYGLFGASEDKYIQEVRKPLLHEKRNEFWKK